MMLSDFKNKVVKAGAGAGKTYNLTHEVIHFAQQFKKEQERWPKCVVTTFTKKATQELKERLMDLSMEEAPETVDFTSSNLYLKVSTIHGLLDLFLKKHGALLGLQSDFSYMSQTQGSQIKRKVLKRVMGEATFPKSVSRYFTARQILSILSKLEEFGPSKDQGLSKSHLISLLQEQKAEVYEELKAVLTEWPSANQKKWLDLELVLKGVLTTLEQNFDFEVFCSQVQAVELRGVVTKANGEVKPFYETHVKPVIGKVRGLTDRLYDESCYDFIEQIHQDVYLAYELYKKRLFEEKLSENAIEISDLEPFASQLVQKSPQGAKEFGAQWDYWLIDEYQDTSPIQVFLLESFIDRQTHYVVGDPQQSIYLFRGAKNQVFENKYQAVQEKGGDVQVLDKNYRSDPELLELINDVSEVLPGSFQRMQVKTPVENSEKVVGRFRVLPEPKEKTNAAEKKSLEAKVLVAEIAKRRKESSTEDTFCVLCRKNADAQMVAEALREQNIDVELHSGGAFWRRQEVMDVLSLLKSLVQPWDRRNLFRLFRSPYFGLTELQLMELFSLEEADWSELLHSQELCKEYSLDLALWQQGRSDLKTLGVLAVYKKLLVSLGYLDWTLLGESSGRSEANIWKFYQLCKDFERKEGAHWIHFLNQCERAQVVEQEKDAEHSKRGPAVTIMTVHASKGLQFDHVFLPFLGAEPFEEKKSDFHYDEDMKLWGIRTPLTADDLSSSSNLFEKHCLKKQHEAERNEQLRVFYVAFTRAVKTLYFQWMEPVHSASWAQPLLSFAKEVGRQAHESYSWEVIREESAESILEDDRRSIVTPRASFMDSSSELENSVESKWSLRSPYRVLMPPALSPKTLEPFRKKQRGIYFHRLLEVLKYPSREGMSGLVAHFFKDSPEEIATALNYLLEEGQAPLAQIIQNGQAEWPFMEWKEGLKQEGQVDLWGIVDDTLWVVDYKSGLHVDQEKDKAQILRYLKVLKEVNSWNGPTKCVVLYPFLQKEFFYEDTP